MGDIDGRVFGSLLAGSLLGIILGSYATGRVPDAVLRVLLATTLIVVGSKLVF